MAKHLSVEKRHRQSETRNRRNRVVKSRVRAAVKEYQSASTPETRREALKQVASVADQAAVKRVIHKNKAARIKSRLARKVNAAAAPSAS
ncbi:MAG: 30S ribosomal protein S20 [Candidatus Zixiibacteriota bacterium]